LSEFNKQESKTRDLKARAIRGGFVRMVALGVTSLLRIGSLIVLARLLEPNDFGLVGMVTVVTGVFELFKDAGLSMATIQRADVTNEQVSTLFWINILVGIILMVLSMAIAPFLVSFYHEPRLLWVAGTLAMGFVFNAAGVQHSAILHREMRFFALTITEVLSLVVSSGVGIVMAFAGYGYWSLVGMALTLPMASTVFLWLATAWIPGRPHRGIGIRSMIRFGGLITLNSLIVYIAYNFEKLLLGRFWGAAALGLYGRAYQLINIPVNNLNSASGAVLFSALSRLQHDPARLKRYFLKGYSLLLALTLPITIFCALFSDDIILVLLGPKWEDAATIFRLLTPTIVIFAIINPMAWLLFSLGLVGRSLKLALVICPIVVTAYILGLPYGPIGVASAYSIAMTLWFVPHILWCIHGTVISTSDLLHASGRPLVSAIVAAVVAFTVQFYWSGLLPALPRLLLGGFVLFVSYIWLLLYVMGQKAFYLELIRELKSRSSLGGDKSVVAL
jgi:O-antigen/teichoic acid export membrane protein